MKREVERTAFKIWRVRNGRVCDSGKNVYLDGNPCGDGQLSTIFRMRDTKN